MSDLSALTETIASTATIRLARIPESTYFCTPIEERFERITRLARRALRIPVAAITFLNEDRQWFKSVAGWAVTEVPNNRSFCPLTLAAGDLTIFEDTFQEGALSQHPLVKEGPQFRFYAGLPIADENSELCGTFCVFDTRPRQFSETDKQTLRDLTALAQREIFGERMKSIHGSMTAKLGIARRESMMDPLTRLWNRRGASMMLEAAIRAANEQKSPIGIAILDLDNFKQINDNFGHLIGDEVLRKTALRLIQNVRTDDSVCRVGGDEFLLIMKDCDPATARETTERIQHEVASTPIQTRQGAIELSTSAGFATCVADEEKSEDTLIEEADQALLSAKAARREEAP